MSVELSESFQDLVDEPEKRFQEFFSFYCDKCLSLSPGLKIQQYLRSGQGLIRMGNVYFNERDYFQAFVFYSRYALLFLEKLPKHPQYSQISPTELAAIKKQVKEIFPRAEKLKLLIKEQYAKEARENAAAKKHDESKPEVSSHNEQDSLRDKYASENEHEYQKILAGQRDIKSPTSTSRPSAPPAVDRSLKPGTISLANVHNFRIVNLPSDTSTKFLDLAEMNTRRNIETCGILAGQLAQNKFHITHCIIPKQSGTSETCSTEEEHELFDAIDSNNLITLGWIHTHPSQTAFLSSVDLHTHFGYQIMIPEAIAIVCAPTYNQFVQFKNCFTWFYTFICFIRTGIYILNPEIGMREVAECSQSGFHPHTTQPPLFQV